MVIVLPYAIAPILGGGRYSGKTGMFNIGVMDIQRGITAWPSRADSMNAFQIGAASRVLVPPGIRVTREEGVPRTLKLDLRNYVYDGKVQLVAARLYQGQTTNFRTAGGGFAPVFYPPA